MNISEDFVKESLSNWLKGQGYGCVLYQSGTRQGYDVEGVHPVSGRRLAVECKGEAKTGSQHSRSWPNVASALLTSLNLTECTENSLDVGMAFPDTKEYQGRMKSLRKFCEKQNILVYWVSENGQVSQW